MAGNAGLDWVALASVAGSSIIGFSGLYFVYKSRTTALRERLHAEQVALLGDVLGAAYDILVRALTIYKLQENPAAFGALERDCKDDLVRLQRLTIKSRMLLPAVSVDALHEYVGEIVKLVGTKRKEDLPEQKALWKAMESFYRVARAELGIDKLSEQTIALFR